MRWRTNLVLAGISVEPRLWIFDLTTFTGVVTREFSGLGMHRGLVPMTSNCTVKFWDGTARLISLTSDLASPLLRHHAEMITEVHRSYTVMLIQQRH